MDVARKEIDICIERLSLPKDSSESLSFCGTSKDELKAYIADLPHASPAELCNRLYHLLPEVASLKVPAGRKLAMLDMIAPEAFDCVRRLTKKIVVTSNTTKILSLSIAMLRHLAQGYKSVLVNALKFPASPPNLLLDSIYGSINALTQALAICWESYIPLPKNIWLELHSLYRIAQLKGLESVNIRSQQVTTRAEATIKAAYAKPLLMACTDPSRYTPKDIRLTLEYLTTTANLMEFVDNLKEGIFIVDSQSDKGPMYGFKLDSSTKHHFRLRTHRLVRHIEERLSKGTLSGIPPRLAKDLCKHWSKEIKRQTDHVYENRGVTLVLGLSHIHRQLTGSKNVDAYLASLIGNNKNLKPGLTLMDYGKKENTGQFLSRQSTQVLLNKKDRPIDFKDDSNTGQQRLYPGTQINHSDRGACIEFDSSSESLSPGELVAFHFSEDKQWHTGVVRWVRITPQLKRRIGIQLFDGTISPCIVSQITSGSAGESQHYPALMIERDKKRSILVPILPFKEYITVQLRDPAGRKLVRLLGCQEETYHIGKFGLEFVKN